MKTTFELLIFSVVLLVGAMGRFSCLGQSVGVYMKADDIQGESASARHKGEIDVLSYSFEMKQTASASTGSGAARPQFGDIVITKNLDKSSPKLLDNCVRGQTLKSVTLVFERGGDKPVKFYEITLRDVLITRVAQSWTTGDAKMTETISLSYGKVSWEYFTTSADGKTSSTGVYGWDLKKNTKI